MALGDIKILSTVTTNEPGALPYRVTSGTTASINAGEPVLKALGSAFVTAGADNTPVVGTNYLAGISTTTSNETASAVGTVNVMPLVPGQVFLCKANDTTLIDTQAEYDALVGDRVLFDLTSGVYTVLLTDGATNGLVVENLDTKLYPNMVAFAIRAGANYLA